MSNGAAVCEKPTPAPVTIRAPKNTHGWVTVTWMMDASITSVDPMPTHRRRPNRSATYEAGIKERKAPSETAAMIKPSALELRSAKNNLTISVPRLALNVRARNEKKEITHTLSAPTNY